MVNNLCKSYGEEIAVVDGVTYYDFPAVEKLKEPEVQRFLEEAKFGYRAKFIQQAASKILEFGGSDWISRLRNLPYKEAKAELIKLPGVGPKVRIRIALEKAINSYDTKTFDSSVRLPTVFV